MKIIETKGNQVFSVPNTAQGREFLKTLRMYSNGNCKITLRGRGKNRRKNGGDASYIPLKNSDWVAVYMDISDQKESQAYQRGKDFTLWKIKSMLKEV